MIDEKKVRGIVEAGPLRQLPDGFQVRTVFSPEDQVIAHIDPFLKLEYLVPVQLKPGNPPPSSEGHSHQGFETVTVVYQGMIQHRDSIGNAGTVGPGDVQWLSAAAGVEHQETFDEEFARQGGMLEMVRLRVNVPESEKTAPPRYQALLKEQIPVTTLGPAGYVRVIAGDVSGVDGPAKTCSPVGIFDLHVNAGHETELCLCDGQNAALVLLGGNIRVNGSADLEGQAVMALLEPRGAMVTIAAREDSSILVISGQPLGESREAAQAN